MIHKPLVIGNLIVDKPIVQGGMGVGISLGNLAGAVAKEGGMGIISSAQIGFNEPDFLNNTFDANLRAIKSELKRAREIAPKGIIGFNIMVALKQYKEQVLEVVKAGADVIISGAGLPTELPEYVKGYKTKIAPIVSSLKSAKVILRYWHKKYGRTADFLVIEGPKAGGHLGFSVDEIKNISIEEYSDEIRDIIGEVKCYENIYGTKIPIIIAGGMRSKEDLKRVYELGANGIQVGTKFVTTKECDAHEKYKEAYANSKKDDIIIVKSPVGMPGRAIKNKFMEKILEGDKFSPKKCLQCLKRCEPKEIPYCITERLIEAAKGNVDEGLLFCGADAYLENNISTVKEVFDSFLK